MVYCSKRVLIYLLMFSLKLIGQDQHLIDDQLEGTVHIFGEIL